MYSEECSWFWGNYCRKKHDSLSAGGSQYQVCARFWCVHLCACVYACACVCLCVFNGLFWVNLWIFMSERVFFCVCVKGRVRYCFLALVNWSCIFVPLDGNIGHDFTELSLGQWADLGFTPQVCSYASRVKKIDWFFLSLSAYCSALAKKCQSVIQTLKKDGVLTSELDVSLRNCRVADELDHVVSVFESMSACVWVCECK